MNRLLSLFVLLVNCSILKSQLPETDLWIIKLEKSKEGQWLLSEPMNFTARAGYDNQPSFSADGRLVYYTSVHEDKQADIYSYDVKKKKILRITTSVESEYSPVLSPAGDMLTTVMVEKDSVQRIHFIELVQNRDIRLL